MDEAIPLEMLLPSLLDFPNFPADFGDGLPFARIAKAVILFNAKRWE